jgi:AraC-like DNA-binding protein
VLPAHASLQMFIKLADSPYRPPQFVRGAHATPTVASGACAPSYVNLVFAPLAGYALLAMPAGELSDHVVDLTDVLGPSARRLVERLRDAPTWPARFRLLDDALLRWAERGRRPTPEVVRAWDVLVASGGRASIAAIARDVGWSHKHLTARFYEQVGLRPKTAARVIRFHRVRRRLSVGQASWGQLAAECGYADQSHLVRDFRDLAGMTPTAYVTTRPVHAPLDPEVQFVQDGTPPRFVRWSDD